MRGQRQRRILIASLVGAGLAIAAAVYAIAFAVGFAYFTVLHARSGQTIGKKALGIRVVSAADHSAVSWGQAIGRQAFVYAITDRLPG